jgi:hypothetical protein
VKLSTDLSDPKAIPYFLWDDPMTVEQLRERLGTASSSERIRLLGKIMREARDTEVWHFTTPAEVNRLWDQVSAHLGHRRDFWSFLLNHWRKEGLI